MSLMTTIPMAALALPQIALRLALASAAGCIVGLEREIRGRPAGLRTTMLACVAAAAVMIFASELLGSADGTSRVIQGILVGIGFLGAGAINRKGSLVQGLTTAAVLWGVTILGMIFGAGQWPLGLIALGLTMFILVGLRYAEEFLHRDWHGTLVVTVQMTGISDTEIKQRLEATKLHVKHVCLEYDLEAKQRTLRCQIKCKRGHLFHLAEQVVTDLAQCRGVIGVNWTNG